MRWYIAVSDRRTSYAIDKIVGVLIAPDGLTKEEVEDTMKRGGYELFVRPYWDYRHTEVYSLMTWEEVSRWHCLQRDVVLGVEKGQFWTVEGYREFLVLQWDEVVRKIVEPLALQELDKIAQRKGSFKRAKKIVGLLRGLDQDDK